MRAPITGGQFAAWGGVFSTIDCTMVAVRKTEDSWNAIVAGGATGALLTIRQGPLTMAVSAGVGCVLLAMIEGVGALMTRMSSSAFDPSWLFFQHPRHSPVRSHSTDGRPGGTRRQARGRRATRAGVHVVAAGGVHSVVAEQRRIVV